MGLYAIYCAVYSARYPHRPYFSSVLRAEEPRPDCVACVLLLVPEFVLLFENNFCFTFQRKCTLRVGHDQDWKGAGRLCVMISMTASSANTRLTRLLLHVIRHASVTVLNGFSKFIFTSKTGFYTSFDTVCVCDDTVVLMLSEKGLNIVLLLYSFYF